MKFIEKANEWYTRSSSVQTMKSWVNRIKSYENIPEVFLESFINDNNKFPYTLLFPENDNQIGHTKGMKLLSIYDDHFNYLDDSTDQGHSLNCKYNDIIYIEQGRVLLQSWLEIKTLYKTIYIHFNTANMEVIEPVVKKLRFNDVNISNMKVQVTQFDKLDFLIPLNFQFISYARLILFPDDYIKNIIYQSEQCKFNGIKFLNKFFFRKMTTSHLTIETKKELIFIKESTPFVSAKKDSYGGIFTYIPQNNINSITFRNSEENATIIMEVNLPNNVVLKLKFDKDNKSFQIFKDEIQS